MQRDATEQQTESRGPLTDHNSRAGALRHPGPIGRGAWIVFFVRAFFARVHLRKHAYQEGYSTTVKRFVHTLKSASKGLSPLWNGCQPKRLFSFFKYAEMMSEQRFKNVLEDVGTRFQSSAVSGGFFTGFLVACKLEISKCLAFLFFAGCRKTFLKFKYQRYFFFCRMKEWGFKVRICYISRLRTANMVEV